jgi:lactate dehydrogenase-like 2-hydroxyacid dehydrogenase
VAVTNTPGAVTDATADIAMTLILMTARRAGEGERMVRAGKWTGWHPVQMLGLHLTGKTVCIIGMGRIGQAIARRCHFGFGCRIVYVNRSPRRWISRPSNCRCRRAGGADVVVLATPGGAETHHLMGRTSSPRCSARDLREHQRGDVVDEAALVAALQAGGSRGRGSMSTSSNRRCPTELMAMENVTLLPHLGTAALEVREAMGRMALENVIAFAEGRDLPNPV